MTEGAIASRKRALGVEITRLRTKRRLNQVQLAALLDVSPGTVCDWERGETSPRITRIAQVASVLETDAGDLLSILLGVR